MINKFLNSDLDNIYQKYGLAAAAGTTVSLASLILMAVLIATGDVSLDEVKTRKIADIVMPPKDLELIDSFERPEEAEPEPDQLPPDVDIDTVEDFIRDFISRSPLTNPVSPITRYINERIDEFKEWDVFITCPLKKGKYTNRKINIGDFIINTSARQLIKESEDKIKFANGKVSSRGIERVGLSEHAVKKAIDTWTIENAERIKKGTEKIDGYPDSIFRLKGRNPLLIIHFIDLFKDKYSNRQFNELQDFAYTTWSISFPPTEYEQKKTDYIVNKVWIQQNFFDTLSDQESDDFKGSDGN